MLTRSDVIELFLVFLGRLPETEDGIEAAISTHADRMGLIQQLMSSAEYAERRYWLLRDADSEAFFRSAFGQKDASARPAPSPSDLRAKIEAAAQEIRATQGQYQPVYGIEEEAGSPRSKDLRLACSLAREHFQLVTKPDHVRIMDVGCNIGFVTFVLAETFPNTIGLDTNTKFIEFCNSVKTLTKSPARFYNKDIIELLDTGEIDEYNLDCVLLLNVVHQMIFARGLEFVRTVLAKLAKRVDVIFIELARKKDYVAHGKDHLLPDDPAAVLSECIDCRIELLKVKGRPLYKITRNRAQFGPIRVGTEKIWFSDSSNPYAGRKYYIGGGQFLKVFRFSKLGQRERHAYDRERRGLLQMSGTLFAPKVYDWTVTRTYGTILMEQISGEPLINAYARFATSDALANFLRQYLSIAARLAEARLYHNDMSGHNVYVLPDASIRIIDFEQTKSTPVSDPFAVMLWTVFDILSGRAVSYEQQIYERLFNREGHLRVDPAHYPEIDTRQLSAPLRNCLLAATKQGSWFEFAAEWSKSL